MAPTVTVEPNSKSVQSLKGIVGKPENPVLVEDMTRACAEARTISEFGAPLKIDEATIDRAARDNPDLPRSFVADTLQGLAEARAGKTTPFAPQDKKDEK